MEYRLKKHDLLDTLRGWSRFLKRKVRLIACGGTALTLLDIKASTKDIDFMVPDEREYVYLINMLKAIGYTSVNPTRWKKEGELFAVDLFAGHTIHTTELLESPLKEDNHIFWQDVGRFYIGILNFYDLISSKLFRGTSADYEDCLMLLKAKGKAIDIDLLKERYGDLARYDVAERRVRGNLQILLDQWDKEVTKHGE